MNEDNRENIRTLLNEWWTIEDIPDEVRTVNVVLIFKEGDKEDLANYRPISLLNTLYKIMAVVSKENCNTKCQALATNAIWIQKKQGDSRRTTLHT